VAEGLVASLSHPGGNLTGVAFLTASLTTKRLEFLLEVAPHAKVIALLANYGTNPQTESIAEDLRTAVLAKGLAFHILAAGTEAEIDKAFADMAALHTDALVVQADPYFNNTRGRLVSLAARYAIPAIHERSAFVVEGGLISYGTSLPDVYRQVGVAAGKVLKGAKPADLPVQQPTKFSLAINLQTAKALGLNVPPSILARADEVIE
jgi:putative ABC transport system substrate-binding protein